MWGGLWSRKTSKTWNSEQHLLSAITISSILTFYSLCVAPYRDSDRKKWHVSHCRLIFQYNWFLFLSCICVSHLSGDWLLLWSVTYLFPRRLINLVQWGSFWITFLCLPTTDWISHCNNNRNKQLLSFNWFNCYYISTRVGNLQSFNCFNDNPVITIRLKDHSIPIFWIGLVLIRLLRRFRSNVSN